MVKIFENIIDRLIQLGPRIIVGITFYPCGLVMGYTFSAFILERSNADPVRYGPLLMGILTAFLVSMAFLILKWFKRKVLFFHWDLLLAAEFCHLLAGGFFFARNLDNVGAFLSFIGHGITFTAGLSYLHIITPKNTRAIFLSSCFTWYLFGIASGISTIAVSYRHNKQHEDNPDNQEWVYANFAWLFLPINILIVILLITIRVFYIFGNIDYKSPFDNDIRIAISNGTLFDKRSDVIKRVNFFYVTKSKQLLISFILIFTDAVHYAIIIYFTFWLSLNTAMSLVGETSKFEIIMWVVYLGMIFGNILLFFFSIKCIFTLVSLGQILIALIGMICYGITGGKVVPLWILCFLFGVNYSNIKLSIIETSHFMWTEVLIFLSYAMKLFSIGVIYLYFVYDLKNSFFYSIDQSTLMANGCIFLIITSLITIIVGIEIPRTYKRSLFEIQYTLLGIVFEKHRIEQLNMRYLNDGTIPTRNA